MEPNNNTIHAKDVDGSYLTEDLDDSSFKSPCLDRSVQIVQTPSIRLAGGCKTPAFLSSLGINQHDTVNTWDSTMETPTSSSFASVNASSAENEKGKLLRKALFGKYESENLADSPVTAKTPVTSTPSAGKTTPLQYPVLAPRSSLSSKRRLSQVFVYPKPVPVGVAPSPLASKASTPKPQSVTDMDVNGDSPVLSQRRRLSQPLLVEPLGKSSAPSMEVSLCGISSPQQEAMDLDTVEGRDLEETNHNEAPDDIVKTSHLPSGLGFATASGKNVSVSADALLAARLIFSEEIGDGEKLCNATSTARDTEGRIPSGRMQIDEETDEETSETLKQATETWTGFIKANGKQVPVSEKAQLAAKSMFQEETESTESSAGTSLGFTTASGKRAQVSEKSLESARRMFQDETGPLEQPSESDNTSIGDSSKPTSTSEAADNPEEALLQERRELLEPAGGPSVGFSSASGKKVQVSEKALEAAKKMFQEAEEEGSLETTIQTTAGTSFGFSSASGKKLQVSEKALEAAKKMFQEAEEEKPLETETTPGTSFGFTSAGGKKLKVSEKALDAANKMFHEEEEKSLEKIVGAGSAAGKKVQVSAEALEAAKKMFQEEEEGPLETATGTSFGFTSASGKKVQVSGTALNAAKSVGAPAHTCAGFTTASGSKAEVSEKSLKYARTMFMEVSDVPGETAGLRTKKGITSLKPEESSQAAISKFQEDVETPKRTADLGGLNRASGARGRLSDQTSETIKPVIKEGAEVGNRAESFLKKRDPSSSRKPTISSSRDRKRSFEDGISHAGASSDSKKIHRSLSDEDLFSRNETGADDESFSSSPTLTKRKRSFPSQKPNTGDTPTESQLFLLDNDPTFVAADVIRARTRARQLQENLITGKSRGFIKPEPGILSRKKSDPSVKRLTLKGSLGRPGTLQESLNAVPGLSSVNSVYAGNAERFFFNAWDHFDPESYRDNGTGIPLGDFTVILSNDNLIGFEEIQAAFLSHKAVDPTLVDSRWIANHYRWIVWKLAAMERSYGLSKQCLTPSNVLEQLKYRYDKEIDRCQRPALRRIMEQDNTPGKTLILCVASIERKTSLALELTDGWYSIKAQCDVAMHSLIESGKVFVGLKLITSGAELVSSGPCHPLEATEATHLKISTNSTRRAKWDARLGYVSRPQPFPVPLSSVYCDGGLVSCVTVMVARVYPLIYREKAKEEIGTVYRSQRAFERKALREEQAYEIMKEKAFTDAVFKIEREEKEAGVWDHSRADNLTDEEKRRQIEEEVLKQLSTSRPSSHTSIPVLKLRLVSAESADSSPTTGSSAMLSIWRPSEELCTLLKEQRFYRLYNLNPSEILRQGELQLNSTSSTRYDEITNQKPPRFARQTTPLALTNESGFKPPFSELDVVGLVVYVSELTNRNAFQDAIITDGSHYLAVRCWGGFEEYALDSLVKVGAFLAFANLGWRSSTYSASLPCAYVSELTTVSTRPGQQYLSGALEKLRADLPDVEEALEGASADIARFLPSKSTPRTPFVNSAPRMSAASPATPAAGSREPVTTRTPVTGTNELVVNRTRLLERYGVAPPLSPLALTPSRNTRLAFKPPFKKPG